MNILIATPTERAEVLADLLSAKGFNTRAIPVMKFISFEDLELKIIIKKLELIHSEDFLIFISPQAAKAYLKLKKDLDKNRDLKNIYAIGAGTANVLLEAGLKNIIFPSELNNALGLLNLMLEKNQNWQDKKVFIIRGAGGGANQNNKILESGLAEAGALVMPIEIYIRQCVVENRELLSSAFDWADLIVLTSFQMAECLFELLDSELSQKNGPQNTALTSTSEKMSEYLKAHGVSHILQLRSLSNLGIVAQICELGEYKKQRE